MKKKYTPADVESLILQMGSRASEFRISTPRRFWTYPKICSLAASLVAMVGLGFVYLTQVQTNENRDTKVAYADLIIHDGAPLELEEGYSQILSHDSDVDDDGFDQSQEALPSFEDDSIN